MLPASLSRWTFNLQTGLVVCVLAALLPVFVLVSLASVKRQDESLARASQQLMAVAALATRGQQPALDGMRLSLGRLTEQPSSTNDDAKAVCRAFLTQAQGDAAPGVRLSLVNRSGTAVCHGRASPGAPLIDDAALGGGGGILPWRGRRRPGKRRRVRSARVLLKRVTHRARHGCTPQALCRASPRLACRCWPA